MDLQLHGTSLAELKQVFEKNAPYRCSQSWDLRKDSNTFLHHSVLQDCFSYPWRQETSPDTAYMNVFLRAVYKNNRVVYLNMKGLPDYHNPTNRLSFYKYIDTAYTDSVLNAYNKKHHTAFTSQDLYEDDLEEFVVFPGFMPPEFIKDSNGVVLDMIRQPFLSWYVMQDISLIKKRDHPALVKMCKSLNPTRKAYGALYLYTLQKLKVPLSTEEKQLIETISHSNEITKYSPGGCSGSQPKKINTFLTRKELEHLSEIIILEGELAR
jgi:hypothetical protein